MKKLFSIFLATLIILTGMHLSLAIHLCGGEVSAVKLSFSLEKASCGMCADEQTASSEKTFSAESCCEDEFAFLQVDNDYNLSTILIYEPVKQLLQVFDIPGSHGDAFFKTRLSVHTNVQPPGKFIASAVNLPDICVFRI